MESANPKGRFAGCFGVLSGLVVCLALIGNPAAPRAEEVTFSLDWVPYGRDAGFYAARAKGFFKEQDLTMKLIAGKGSADSVKRLSVGDADYANPDAGTLVISRARGAKVKIIGAFHAKGIMTVVSFKDGPIQTLKDFEGKTCADGPFSSTHRVFPALARQNGVDPAKVKWQFMDPGSIGAAFLAGRVDCTGMYATNLPSLVKGAKGANRELNVFWFAENRLDTYSNSISATDAKLSARPQEVKRFLTGLYKGFAWAVEHPQEAVDIILKELPVLNRETALEHWSIAIDHLLDEGALKNGAGYVDRKKMTFTRDVMAETYNLKVKPPVNDLYTMEHLPKIMVKRPAR